MGRLGITGPLGLGPRPIVPSCLRRPISAIAQAQPLRTDGVSPSGSFQKNTKGEVVKAAREIVRLRRPTMDNEGICILNLADWLLDIV